MKWKNNIEFLRLTTVKTENWEKKNQFDSNFNDINNPNYNSSIYRDYNPIK